MNLFIEKILMTDITLTGELSTTEDWRLVGNTVADQLAGHKTSSVLVVLDILGPVLMPGPSMGFCPTNTGI